MAGAGNGPLCPANPRHGRMYSRDRGGDPSHGYRCMHTDHGGNGKAFTDKEASGEYELQENDVTALYESAATEVIAGRTTLDAAVQSVAKTAKRPTAQVREALLIMIDTIKEKDITMAEKKAAAAKAKTAKAAPAPKGERRRLEHVEGSEFARVRDELGLSNKQAAEATGEAGMGASATYIYILTHQGSSIKLFEKYQKALKDYAKKNKVKKPKPAAVAEEPAEETEAVEAEAVEEAAEEIEADEAVAEIEEAVEEEETVTA